MKPFLCEHPCQLQHGGVDRVHLGLTQMYHSPLETGSNLTQRKLEIWCNSSRCHRKSGYFKQSQCSVPPAFPALFFPKGFLVWWMKYCLYCVNQPTKAGAGHRSLNEKYLSYGFSQHRHYCLIHSHLSVTGFHNFLCRISEASVAAEHTTGNCACGRDGPVWDVGGSECPVKGICHCHLPLLSAPQSKIRWEFHWGNLERAL